jgi:transposase InsO family protein
MRRKAVMPWKEVSQMSERKGFIEQAKAEGANISALCREFGISRKTGYKWLKRERTEGVAGLDDRSRRPKNSPEVTEPIMEEHVLAVREEHQRWGGRKIRRVLQNAGNEDIPSASTITAILRRRERINPLESQKHTAFQRFEKEQPNELWQMDFKGYFALAQGGYCHPLTVLDDHSRFLVGLKACQNQTYETVQAHLIQIFRQFGLPERMLMDNGSPWGDGYQSPYTILSAWLIRLGIAITHGRPYHPQTQGKDERLNRTLLEEVIQQYAMDTLDDSQAIFDDWWYTYNYLRPHEALALQVPATCYQPSPRPYPEFLPPIVYDPNDIVRKVDQSGKISFRNKIFRIGKAFRYQPVALRPSDQDGTFQVFFCQQQLASLSL